MHIRQQPHAQHDHLKVLVIGDTTPDQRNAVLNRWADTVSAETSTGTFVLMDVHWANVDRMMSEIAELLK